MAEAYVKTDQNPANPGSTPDSRRVRLSSHAHVADPCCPALVCAVGLRSSCYCGEWSGRDSILRLSACRSPVQTPAPSLEGMVARRSLLCLEKSLKVLRPYKHAKLILVVSPPLSSRLQCCDGRRSRCLLRTQGVCSSHCRLYVLIVNTRLQYHGPFQGSGFRNSTPGCEVKVHEPMVELS